MYPNQNITRIITCLAAIITSFIIIIFPLGYFLISYLDLSENLKLESEISLEKIKKIINVNPQYWEFESVRLSEILSDRSLAGKLQRFRLTNNYGGVILESTEDLLPPVMARHSNIMDSGVVIGKIEVCRSLWPVLKHTIGICIFMLPIGIGTFIIFRMLPIRKIARIEKALHRAYGEIEKKVKERTIKLSEANDRLVAEAASHRRTYEALRHSEEQHRTLIEGSSDAIITTDENFFIIQWNRAATAIFGYKEEDVMNKPVDVLVADNYQKFFLEKVEQSLKSDMNRSHEAAGVAISLVGRTRNKKEVPIEFSISVYKRQERQRLAFIIRDITERKKAEKKRLELEDRLNRAKKMEAMGILAGGVAHDLNNVIGPIIGYSQLLLFKNEIKSSEDISKKLRTIIRSSERATAIIQDMLTLARRAVHVEKVVNLNTVIKEYLMTPEYERLLSFHPDVRVKTSLASDLPNVKGSPVHFGKTIMNLVSNAAEAMPMGGVVSIITYRKDVDDVIHGYEDIPLGSYVVIEIADTGQGISADDMDHIFEPFYTKKVMGKSGTGLGLSVVWGAVKDFGGYIDLISDQENGTIFSLYLPWTFEKEFSNALPKAISEYTGNGESILIVDDILEQREVAISMLDSLNYKVDAVSSGEEAVAYLKSGQKADLVVLDMIMDPGMDGLETYAKILGLFKRQKAVIVSGFSETDRVTEAIRLGASSYVQKPYLAEDLGRAIRNSLMTAWGSNSQN